MNKYTLTKNIYIFRHGETDWNIEHRSQGGENDIKLNETGRKQALLVGNYLSNTKINADLIISSGMFRADETANIIAKKINYQLPVLIIEDLKEKLHGKLSGLTKEDIVSNPEFDKYTELNNKYNKEKDPIRQREIYYENIVIFNKLYGDELYSTFRHRLKKSLKEIYNRKEKNIIIISHFATIMQLLQIMMNTEDYLRGDYIYGSNCHMTYIQVFEKKIDDNKVKRKIKIIKLLTTAHLYTE